MKRVLLFLTAITLLTGCTSMPHEKTAPCRMAYAGHNSAPCDPLPVNIARAPLSMERHS